MLAAEALTAPLGLKALLDGQGALYLLAGAEAAVGLGRPARNRRLRGSLGRPYSSSP